MARARRTPDQMAAIKAAIREFAVSEGPVTVRQTFYRLSNLGLIPKDEKAYKGTVSRVMTDMREQGELDWDLVDDNTRYRRGPNLYDSPRQLLEEAQRLYRRNIWSTQPVMVEVWLEKEALAGIVTDSTYDLGVGLYVNRGYGSATFIHDAAVRIDRRAPKRTHILYYGDWDPSGADMSRDLHDRLERYTEMRIEVTYTSGATKVELPFTVHRMALTPAIIAAHSLPTRPTKQSDSRAAGFVGDSVELDALPPSVLRQMVRDDIEPFIDRVAMDAILLAEESERGVLATIAESMRS